VKAQGIDPALVVVDTASWAMEGLEESSARDAGIFLGGMDFIRKALRCAVAIIHHSGKDGSKGERGSSALPANVDFRVEVECDHAVKAVRVWMRKQKDAERRQAPWHYEGRECAGSLAFASISGSEYHALTEGTDDMAPRQIGAALLKLGQPVSTHVLALEVAGPEASVEEIGIVERALGKLAKGKLGAYCNGVGRALKWSILSGA